MDGETKLIEMELREIQMKNDLFGTQIVVLAEKEGGREFPIFVGFNEMQALDNALHHHHAPRPMTHDLIVNVFQGLGSEIKRVLIDDLHDETFFGKLVLGSEDGEEQLIDARPSDALVIASKCQVPIFVAQHVLDSLGREEESEDDDSPS